MSQGPSIDKSSGKSTSASSMIGEPHSASDEHQETRQRSRYSTALRWRVLSPMWHVTRVTSAGKYPPGASWCAMEHPERCEHSERGISGFLMNGWMKVQDGQESTHFSPTIAPHLILAGHKLSPMRRFYVDMGADPPMFRPLNGPSIVSGEEKEWSARTARTCSSDFIAKSSS